MAMPDSTGSWTVAMLDALPEDGQRYEIIDGVLYVTPAPRVRHQHVVTMLAVALAPYVTRVCRAVLLVAPTDVRNGERTSVQPDVLAVRLDETGRVSQPVQPSDLLLAISTGRRGRILDRRRNSLGNRALASRRRASRNPLRANRMAMRRRERDAGDRSARVLRRAGSGLTAQSGPQSVNGLSFRNGGPTSMTISACAVSGIVAGSRE